jgi:AraC family transcriptional regulator
LAKIAVALDQALNVRRRHDQPGVTIPNVLARGEGWSVADVVCTAGPDDRPFEEAHACATIAVVVAGSFTYRSSTGRALMTPGAMMLGNRGRCYTCGHEHGDGDRCVSFWYGPEVFERVLADVGARVGKDAFTAARLPPLRELAPLVALAARGVLTPDATAWEELSVTLAARVVGLAGDPTRTSHTPLNAEARVAAIVHEIDHGIETASDASLTLADLAKRAGLSPYHFLRTFEQVTGVTPHQYILRARLRRAAIRLAMEPTRVLDIALETGFGDLSNFNRTFRMEFGASPRLYRRSHESQR